MAGTWTTQVDGSPKDSPESGCWNRRGSLPHQASRGDGGFAAGSPEKLACDRNGQPGGRSKAQDRHPAHWKIYSVDRLRGKNSQSPPDIGEESKARDRGEVAALLATVDAGTR